MIRGCVRRIFSQPKNRFEGLPEIRRQTQCQLDGRDVAAHFQRQDGMARHLEIMAELLLRQTALLAQLTEPVFDTIVHARVLCAASSSATRCPRPCRTASTGKASGTSNRITAASVRRSACLSGYSARLMPSWCRAIWMASTRNVPE